MTDITVRTPLQSDRLQCPPPDALQMSGLIGRRLEACRVNRLRHHEEYHLLWPFQEHCPVGYSHPDAPHPEIARGDWQGEFIGAWVNAATLAAWNAGDQVLGEKLEHLIDDWLATQQEDGYLGTFDEVDRWKSWDVWVQAHNLLGLLSYYRYTGSRRALEASVRVADRLLKDFGPERSHMHTGPHGGMASGAILEPMIWLYWETGDSRYLDWGRWLVDDDWEAEGGAKISSSLLKGQGVAGTANGKAVEMMIDFAGMVELYRATGDERYLTPVLIAWEDIVCHHLYITGSASTGEVFQPDYVLRNDGMYHLGETCVSMAWLHLNLSLGRLTGEARFFDMAEQCLYNHLLGAQSPDGRGWAYYVGLRDSKRYRWHTDPDCCPSRGSRALAQMPQHVVGLAEDGLSVNFYEPAQASLRLPSGLGLNVSIEGNYPFTGDIQIKLNPQEAHQFKVYLRLPGWCKGWSLRVNDQPQDARSDARGYLVLERAWAPGDMLELDMQMPVQALVDELGNNGRVAFTRGPLVYAADSAYLPHAPAAVREMWQDAPPPVTLVSQAELPGMRLLEDVMIALDRQDPIRQVHLLESGERDTVHLVVPGMIVHPAASGRAWNGLGRYYELAGSGGSKTLIDLELVPFFEAGNRDPSIYRDGVWRNDEPVGKVTYQVWLPYLQD